MALEARDVSEKITKLTLDTLFDFEMEGDGDQVVLRQQLFRVNKAGNRERYDIRTNIPRWLVKRLMVRFREMHRRDRARLAREERRIADEVRALTEEPTP